MKEIPFNISARTAKLIGQENFANAEGAVIELVKNGYDADATACIIVFDELESSLYIIDDGEGMTEDTISRHWMTIGTDHKNNNEATGKSRIKTGAKGIGRFALDRLGGHCEMITNTEKTKPIEWQVSWNQFDGADIRLTDVKATIEEIDSYEIKSYVSSLLAFIKTPNKFFDKHFTKNTGTVIKITSLRDSWSENAIEQLFQNLEQLIPPLEINSFGIYLYSSLYPNQFGIIEPEAFDDYDYKLSASVSLDHKAIIKITRNELDLNGLISRHFFENNQLVGPQYSLDTFKKGEFTINASLEELIPGFKDVDKNNLLDKIGPFEFSFYFLKRGGAQEKDEDERKYPYNPVNYAVRSQLLSRYGGIKIFRDNFRVRPYGEVKSTAFDWLDLGVRAARNPTITRPGYSVRPNQVYGIVNISKVTNIAFQDKSNREGLQENESFTFFKQILLAIINKFEIDRSTIMLTIDKLWKEQNKQEEAKEEATNDSKAYKKKKAARKAKKGSSSAQGTQGQDTEEQEELLEDADKVIERLELAIAALKEDNAVLREEQKLYRVLTSAGLTVSSFAHELKNLSGRTLPRSDYLREVLEELLKPNDVAHLPDFRNPFIMVSDIKSDDERVSQWLDFSLASLKRDKRTRTKIDLVTYVEKLQRTWAALLSQKQIKLTVKKTNFLNVYFKGFEIDLDTIFNNLIVNSVEAFVRPGVSDRREITLSFAFTPKGIGTYGISIIYEDSGPGLASEIKDAAQILQPFFTTKRDNQTGEIIGTGLGMWLIKSTIDDYSGKIQIGAERPGFKALIDLPA